MRQYFSKKGCSCARAATTSGCWLTASLTVFSPEREKKKDRRRGHGHIISVIRVMRLIRVIMVIKIVRAIKIIRFFTVIIVNRVITVITVIRVIRVIS